MNYKEYNELFGSEEKCMTHFIEQRKKSKIVCKKCKRTKHYFIKSRMHFECANKACKSTVSVKSGTIMMHSNFSFKVWYDLLFEMTRCYDNFPITQLTKLIGRKRYASVWYCSHKIRMAFRKDNLKREFEFIKKQNEEVKKVVRKHNEIPRSLELSFTIDNKKVSQFYMQHYRLLWPDKKESYRFHKIVNLPDLKQIKRGNIKEVPTWIQISLTEVSLIINRVHKQVSDFYLQLFIDEFCYKANANSKQMLFLNSIELLNNS